MYKNKKLIDVKTKEEKEEVKQCSDCEEVKPVGEFFMQSAKLRTRQTFCKECSKVRKDKLAKKKAKELANKPAGERKFCRTCSDEKELSEFYVSSRDGTMPDCKECTSARARERKAAKPNARKMYPIEKDGNGIDVKECSVCHERKNLQEFSPRSKEKGTFQPRCKSCDKAIQRACCKKRTAKNIAKRDSDGNSENVSKSNTKGKGRKPLHDVILNLAGEPSKECCRCGEIKSIEEFYSDISKATGKTAACKKCWNKGGTVSKKHQLTYNFNMRIALNLRSRLRHVLKAQDVPKTNSVLLMLGCDVGEFRAYLQEKLRGRNDLGELWEMAFGSSAAVLHVSFE